MFHLKMNKNDLKVIGVLALPVVVETILQTLLGTVDTFFAGQISDDAIAAVGVTNLIVNIFIALFTAVSVGTLAVIGRYVGRGDMESGNRALQQSVLLSLFIGVSVGLMNLVFYRPILKVSGAGEGILDYAVPYYMVVVVPIVFLCLSLVLSSCLRATKDNVTPMVATGIANVLNIFLNVFFIRLGFGIAGLALATTLSRVFGVALLAARLVKGNGFLRLPLKGWVLDAEMLRSILRIGIPAGGEKLIMRAGQLVYGAMILSIGADAYVAHNIAGTIENYTYIPSMGFGVAAATLVGIGLGENNPEKARRMALASNTLSTIFMVLMGVVIFIFAPFFAAAFTQTPEVQTLAVTVLRMIALFQPCSALTQVIESALQGAGDTRYPMLLTLFGIWGIRVCVGYFLGVVCGFGLVGVWTAYILDITVRGFLLLRRFNGGKWQMVAI
ncbi:MATE family efflux transporter [Eubacterium sp. 1001713B170207_170306_E7]|uniref:MATE family efflux transporter n=1 Tax=Eubacterium sp. 1001713B170207_170306_E7 TaxID=2787097 RepID=UPI001896FA64|nr:MATE family efflux transporter [Eubacterium sp. 1001713B170207_170306_E7]